MSKKAVLVNFDGSAHFFAGKEPKDFVTALQRDKFIALPSGSLIATASVKGVYTYEDYMNLHYTADHHKRHEWLSTDGYWHGPRGEMLERADLTGLINKCYVPETNKEAIGAGAAQLERGA